MININELTTETINSETTNIDQLSSLEIVELINNEDIKVANAVKMEAKAISIAIDEIAKRYRDGGRIIYIGAGSSGRMGTLDAVELTPTYSVPPTRAFGILAGGKEAMYSAIEGAEDSKPLAVEDLKKVNLDAKDTVIGIAASGRTPYTISAMEYANKTGALSVSITCNKDSEMDKLAEIAISPVVGAEVISGSTRMKAGTAQKMIVNMISTGVMVKLGKVYQNYMVHVQPTNEKLRIRAAGIISAIVNVDNEEASLLLEAADNNVAVAIVMFRAKATKIDATNALKEAQGQIRTAIELAKGVH